MTGGGGRHTVAAMPSRSPRARCGALLAAGLAGLAIVPAAHASTLSKEGDTLVFRAAPGESNSLYVGNSFGPEGNLRLEDAYPITSVPAGCTLRDDTMVDCAVPARLRVELGDGDDSLGFNDDTAPAVAVEALGGDGDDTLYGDHTANRREVLDGGPGKDTLDGFGGNDEVRGGAGDDTLEGNGGNDTVLGGDGNDTLNGDDQAAPGADLVDGGAGTDTMKDYVEYGTEVHPPADVSLNGVADDGRAGEGDNIVSIERMTAYVSGRHVLSDGPEEWQVWANMDGGASTIEARGGNDTITGEDAAETIDGGAGDDRLEGGRGHDTITGGPGRDSIYGDETDSTCTSAEDCLVYGNDVIDARDGEPDMIDCGPGADRVTADPADTVAPNCEVVDRGAAGDGPGPGGDPAGGPKATKRLARVRGQRLAKVLRRGLKVRLTGAKPGKARIVARKGRRIVASTRVKVPASGKVTARLRFTKPAKRALRRAKRVKLTVAGAGLRATVTIRR
jgi:hypothetical protein